MNMIKEELSEKAAFLLPCIRKELTMINPLYYSYQLFQFIVGETYDRVKY